MVQLIDADPAAIPLENARWEQVANASARGANNVDAYLSAYPDLDRATANAAGARLLAMVSVSNRVTWLKAQNAQRSQLSRDEAMAFLAEVVRARVAQLPEDSALVQSVKRDAETGAVTEIRVPDKLEALKLNARMAGWDTPNVGLQVNILSVSLGGDA